MPSTNLLRVIAGLAVAAAMLLHGDFSSFSSFRVDHPIFSTPEAS